jgi:hypothetical protein
MSSNGKVLVIAIFLFALGAGGVPPKFVHAEEDCLAAPSGRPPPGNQWHYRTDHIKQRKCWHLQTQGEKGETATASAAATRGAAERPKRPPDHLEDKPQAIPENTAGLRGSTAPASTQGGGVERQQPPAWPQPRAPAAPDNTAWPDPPSPAHAGNVALPASPMAASAEKAEEPEAPIVNSSHESDPASEVQVVAEAEFFPSRTFLSVLLISAAALVIVGIFASRWVKTTLSRHTRSDMAQHVPRRNAESTRVANVAPDDQTRRALQKLLRVLEKKTVRG